MTIPSYIKGAEARPLTIEWEDPPSGFPTGWTLSAYVGIPDQPAVISKTSNITGAATSPHVTITWAAGELDVLTPGTWTVQVTMVETGTGKDDKRSFLILIKPAVLAPA